MTGVATWILHREPGAEAGPIERWVARSRHAVAARHAEAFARLGSTAEIVAGPPDDTPFGARLRSLVRGRRPDGVIVMGSGAAPLATPAHRRAFVEAAEAGAPVALANDRYSADIVAVACAERLRDIPDLATDNALPRWLAEEAGYAVSDRRRDWRLGFDIDGPLDLVLAGDARTPEPAVDTGLVRSRLDAIRAVAADPAAELLVAGRTSSWALAWLERTTAGRVRALVEERGLRTSRAGQRPPASVLGALLDRDGPESLGEHVSRLGDAALVDTRVLLAHRLGANEGDWPVAEDRFASDLLLADGIDDGWLRALTAAARDAPIPIVLGGHTLVGPGIRLALPAGTPRRPWS
jgi:hypothetical protein